MNERIKELWDKAGKTHSGESWEELTAFMNCFAELIVRECASICDDNSRTYKYSFTPMKAQLAESTSKFCGELIKRNFGIEEK